MNYQKPDVRIQVYEERDIVTVSVPTEDGGTRDPYDPQFRGNKLYD